VYKRAAVGVFLAGVPPLSNFLVCFFILLHFHAIARLGKINEVF